LRPFPEGLLPGVRPILLPGHTAAAAGLAFTWLNRRALIAGDAVMTHDFFAAETGYFNSADFAAASETIRKIKAEFDFVIPGHDMLIPV
jgi:glyoxylase-like metal-dependent hydrolase (beta-lactamase superfamily II)